MTQLWQELKEEQKNHQYQLYIFMTFCALGLMLVKTWNTPMLVLFLIGVLAQGIAVDIEGRIVRKKEEAMKKKVQKMETEEEKIQSVKIIKGNLDYPKVKIKDNSGKEKELRAQVVKYKGTDIKIETYKLPDNMMSEEEKLRWLVHPVIYVPEKQVISIGEKNLH